MQLCSPLTLAQHGRVLSNSWLEWMRWGNDCTEESKQLQRDSISVKGLMLLLVCFSEGMRWCFLSQVSTGLLHVSKSATKETGLHVQ